MPPVCCCEGPYGRADGVRVVHHPVVYEHLYVSVDLLLRVAWAVIWIDATVAGAIEGSSGWAVNQIPSPGSVSIEYERTTTALAGAGPQGPTVDRGPARRRPRSATLRTTGPGAGTTPSCAGLTADAWMMLAAEWSSPRASNEKSPRRPRSRESA